jgi:hypothetical protein
VPDVLVITVCPAGQHPVAGIVVDVLVDVVVGGREVDVVLATLVDVVVGTEVEVVACRLVDVEAGVLLVVVAEARVDVVLGGGPHLQSPRQGPPPPQLVPSHSSPSASSMIPSPQPERSALKDFFSFDFFALSVPSNLVQLGAAILPVSVTLPDRPVQDFHFAVTVEKPRPAFSLAVAAGQPLPMETCVPLKTTASSGVVEPVISGAPATR